MNFYEWKWHCPIRKVFLCKSKLDKPNSTIEKNPIFVKNCSICFGVIAKGKSHKCMKSKIVDNISNSIKNSCILKEKEKITSSLIKDIIIDSKNESNSLSISLTQPKGGANLCINVGKPEKQKDQLLLSVDDFKKIRDNFNLSYKTTIGIATCIRTSFKDRKCIESNLKQKLLLNNHSVDEYFNAKKFDFIQTKNSNVSNYSASVICCSEVDGFITHVKNSRELNDPILKFGIDGGRGFLKICLSIQSLSCLENYKKNCIRQSYKDGIASKKFKDSGVKKVFILALAPYTQENYENVLQLWSELNLNNFKGNIATDLKLANLLIGIMSHSSTYPCTWCYAKKNNLHEIGNHRTIGNITQNYVDWRDAGSDQKKAKDFKNCIHAPIIKTAVDQLILDVIPPPELHLMLGVVNTLYEHMFKKFELDAANWAKFCHVEREVTYGSSGFKGNSCKILLSKVDVLRSTCTLGCLKFVDAFDKFNSVVKSCFSIDLHPAYKENILSFQKSYLALEIPITPKIHAVFFHVEEFCTKMQKGLGYFSEQAMESVHHDFSVTWEKYKVFQNHPDYEKQLLKAVCAYNSHHV